MAPTATARARPIGTATKPRAVAKPLMTEQNAGTSKDKSNVRNSNSNNPKKIKKAVAVPVVSSNPPAISKAKAQISTKNSKVKGISSDSSPNPAAKGAGKNKNKNKNKSKNKGNDDSKQKKQSQAKASATKKLVVPKKPEIFPGYQCKAKFTEDGIIYDCVIERLIGKNWVTVAFIGYGNKQRTKVEDLIHLTAKEIATQKDRRKAEEEAEAKRLGMSLVEYRYALQEQMKIEERNTLAERAAANSCVKISSKTIKTRTKSPQLQTRLRTKPIDSPPSAFDAAFELLCKTPERTAANDIISALTEKSDSPVADVIAQQVVETAIDAINDKKSKTKNEAGLLLFSSLASSLGGSVEPFLMPWAPTLLTHASTNTGVTSLAIECVDALLAFLSKRPTSVAPFISSLLAGTDIARLPRVRISCFKRLADLTVSHKEEVSLFLPGIVPVLIGSLRDSNVDVSAAAHATFSQLCSTCIDNKDVEPFVPDLIACMKDPDATEETIFKLASTTFVQTVTAPALSVVVPLLSTGFSDPSQALKRQCAVITSNMSKLVEIPYEAQPFLPELLPALKRCSETVSDPEARDVCSNALRQLQKIQKSIELTGGRKSAQEILSVAKEKLDESAVAFPGLNDVLTHVSFVFHSFVLGELDRCDFWIKAAEPFLSQLLKSEEIVNVVSYVNEKCRIVAAEDDNDDGDDAEQLCDCKFTLAYGSKILLHATHLKIKRGRKYGLLGPNDCGKTTLMRAISNGQLEDQGFPAADELKCIFVEADIQGEQSHLSCVEYIQADERITSAGITSEQISQQLLSVGFSEKNAGSGTAGIHDGVWTLSGGWRMKLALARAMLQQADILLMDEPTNHLDVLNVAWVQNYLLSLKDVTVIMVSTHTKTLEMCCQSILYIRDLKLEAHHMKISQFRDENPEAESFFSFKATKMTMKFPQPGELNGIKSKGRALMKMDNCTFTYPVNDKPTLHDITCRVSLGSRVACVGINGAGKSTMIKLLTQELTPQIGDVWKHDNVRVAYVAQHAFHHIEKHLEKSANEYIRWRYQYGEDKEGLEKTDTKISDEEKEALKAEMKIPIKDENTGKVNFIKRNFEEFTGARKAVDQKFLYEVAFAGLHPENNMWLEMEKVQESFPKAAKAIEKLCRAIDLRISALEGQYRRALTRKNVEEHLQDIGLAPEYSTHTRLQALSGGQKVKVALAAALWSQPHIIILDEPTNYLDRDSLGALAGAIEEFDGGVVIISHNEDFTHALCKETWVLEEGRLTTKGDAEWMKNIMNEKVVAKSVETVVDGMGNVTKVKGQKKQLSRAEIKKKKRIRKMKIAAGEPVSDDSDLDD